MARFSWPVKWLLAPLAAGVLGYWVIGPRLAGKVKLPEAVKQGVGKFVPVGEPRESASAENTPEAAPSPPPSVTTDAEPMATEEPKPRRRRRRHREDE